MTILTWITTPIYIVLVLMVLIISIPLYLFYTFIFNLIWIEITDRELEGVWWYVMPIIVPTGIIGVIALFSFGVAWFAT